MAGEDRVKAAAEKYLPRLIDQPDDEYEAYRARAAFYNGSARTAESFVGMIFRRAPFLKVPEGSTALAKAVGEFVNDCDMLGTSLGSYAKNVVREVVAVGRAGTLIDWEGYDGTNSGENRVYCSLYAAEDIINWRVERVDGWNTLTLLVLREMVRATGDDGQQVDEYETKLSEQVRVLRLEHGADKTATRCVVEVWRPQAGSTGKSRRAKTEWVLVDTLVPLRLGKPLPQIPFVFHGPRDFLPNVDKLPLADVIAVNLDHYRLDADYKHGMHYTALPTAWVSGFDKGTTLRIGSSTAWVTSTVGAAAGFLEYTGQGLTTFERAMDRDERLMAVLGARLLEPQKRVGETAQAIEQRQSGENSVLASLANSVGTSLTHVMRWAYWWNSTEEWPDDVTKEQVCLELSTDFSVKGLSSQDIVAVVQAWQAGAISRDSMSELFRRGEVLPEGRTNEEEAELVKKEERAKTNGEAVTRIQGTGITR